MTEEQAIERIAHRLMRHQRATTAYAVQDAYLIAELAWNEMKAIARDDELEGLHKAGHMLRQTPPHLAVKA